MNGATLSYTVHRNLPDLTMIWKVRQFPGCLLGDRFELGMCMFTRGLIELSYIVKIRFLFSSTVRCLELKRCAVSEDEWSRPCAETSCSYSFLKFFWDCSIPWITPKYFGCLYWPVGFLYHLINDGSHIWKSFVWIYRGMSFKWITWMMKWLPFFDFCIYSKSANLVFGISERYGLKNTKVEALLEKHLIIRKFCISVEDFLLKLRWYILTLNNNLNKL